MYNPFSLEDRTVLITGASSGIGRATAIECSKMGATVIITGRNDKRLQETLTMMEGCGHMAILADLATDDGILKLVEACPRLDGLVNNAGFTYTVLTNFISKEALSNQLQVNTIAPILLLQKLLKAKKIQKGSSIVFTSSISGSFCAGFGNVLYSTSKSAINGFVKNAALDLAKLNIRVNAVAPGMIETHILDSGIISKEQLESDRQRYPLKRFGKPEEVAFAIIYLLSKASSFTTGSVLVIDGGYTLQ